jgi:NAD(P)-dependent dehydrogenase (short-subunit alcohol dehydrogenase family)
MTNLERILVVGGTSGTGLLIAKRLFREAYSVRVLARDPDRAAHSLEMGSKSSVAT